MRVYIIGAGGSGLAMAKHLIEEGIDVELLEKRDGLGGLWYIDKNIATVANNTTATSSKAYLQFSDFHMDDLPHFPHHTAYVDYLKRYAEVHNLTPFIKYNREVLRLQKHGEKWNVSVRHRNETYTETVDAVAICSGLHHVPLMPEIPGSDDFQGLKIHSSLLKNPEDLQGKRVMAMGAGESAADVVHELAPIASEVYLSLRRGVAITHHWGLGNLPADYEATRACLWLPRQFLHDYQIDCRLRDRYCAFKTAYTLLSLPFLLILLSTASRRAFTLLRGLVNWRSWVAIFKHRQRHGPASGIELSQACEQFCDEAPHPQSKEEVEKKAFRLKFIFDWYSGEMHNSQPFTKQFDFLKDIVEKKIRVVPSISRYSGGLKVEFDNKSEVEADAVVMCTGFQSTLPFLKESVLDGRQFYKNVFLPGERGLGFIGFVRPGIGGIPPLAEMQARWFSGVLSGRLRLPDAEQMKRAIEADSQRYTESRKLHAQRLTSLVDYHAYIEELAGFVGCRPKLWRLLWKPRVLHVFLYGPMGPFQYRMHGYSANRDAVMKAVAQIPALPVERIFLHTVLYFIMKPSFFLLGKMGFRKFRPVF